MTHGMPKCDDAYPPEGWLDEDHGAGCDGPLNCDRCELCGEGFGPRDEVAEMADPKNSCSLAVICHAQCGIDRGLEVA